MNSDTWTLKPKGKGSQRRDPFTGSVSSRVATSSSTPTAHITGESDTKWR